MENGMAKAPALLQTVRSMWENGRMENGMAKAPALLQTVRSIWENGRMENRIAKARTSCRRIFLCRRMEGWHSTWTWNPEFARRK